MKFFEKTISEWLVHSCHHVDSRIRSSQWIIEYVHFNQLKDPGPRSDRILSRSLRVKYIDRISKIFSNMFSRTTCGTSFFIYRRKVWDTYRLKVLMESKSSKWSDEYTSFILYVSLYHSNRSRSYCLLCDIYDCFHVSSLYITKTHYIDRLSFCLLQSLENLKDLV